jgi:hypothetical protein
MTLAPGRALRLFVDGGARAILPANGARISAKQRGGLDSSRRAFYCPGIPACFTTLPHLAVSVLT